MTIDGKAADTQSTFPVTNPATGVIEASAPECAPSQLDDAMASAQRAFLDWRRDEGARRTFMLDLAGAIRENAEDLTRLLVSESGKPVAQAAQEPVMCAMWLEYYANLELPREMLSDTKTARVEVVHRPLGVVGAITPWNYPLLLSMWKIAPALRAGNTVVVKPSPFTPLAALRMGELMGGVLPAGVVNTITGGDSLGAALSTHPTPRKLAFTGSISGGKSVAISAGHDLKRLTLELGGNDPAILLDDVDAADVAAKLVRIAFVNTGQACALPKRIFAPASRYDEIVEAFAAVADQLRVGDPFDPSTDLGPLSTEPQYHRVRGLLSDALEQGARAVNDGGPLDRPGFFFKPIILADAMEGQRVVDEEQFGPVLPVLAYKSVDDAVRRANDTRFGLAGSVWSANEDRAAELAEQLDVGTTHANTHGVMSADVPFGGAKWSGVGVENGLSGLLAYTDPQVVHRAKAPATRD